MKILISVWEGAGVYTISYDESKDPSTVIECVGDAPEVDDQVIFEAIDKVKEAVKEE